MSNRLRLSCAVDRSSFRSLRRARQAHQALQGRSATRSGDTFACTERQRQFQRQGQGQGQGQRQAGRQTDRPCVFYAQAPSSPARLTFSTGTTGGSKGLAAVTHHIQMQHLCMNTIVDSSVPAGREGDHRPVRRHRAAGAPRPARPAGASGARRSAGALWCGLKPRSRFPGTPVGRT